MLMAPRAVPHLEVKKPFAMRARMEYFGGLLLRSRHLTLGGYLDLFAAFHDFDHVPQTSDRPYRLNIHPINTERVRGDCGQVIYLLRAVIRIRYLGHSDNAILWRVWDDSERIR